MLLLINEKKTLRETKTLRAGWSKAEPKKFRPAADPFSGGAGRPKFNQLETVTTFTYRPSLVKIDARIFRVIVVTDPQTNTQTNTQTHTHTQTDRTDNNTLRR